MKKTLFTTLLMVIVFSVFSQSPTKHIQLRPAYPILIGETTIDSLIYSNNGLYMYDILQDSLPKYEIGHIFAQTVRYTEEGHGFYVKADSLHSNNVVYSIEIDSLPAGPIEFNSTTGRFKFYPAAEDYRTFFVTFRATNGQDTIVEVVEFNIMPQVVSEEFAFQSQGVMPDGTDYTTIAETSTNVFLNNENRTAYSYSVSGKDVVFDNSVQNKVWGLSGREDIYELNIYAEKLYIRSALEFPQTNVTIYAKEIFFEDHDSVIASINTSPTPIATLTNGQGMNGANAGNISLYVKEFHGNFAKRLILNGSKGQSSNRNGIPGNGGNGGNVISNVNINNYCDYVRGSGGLKFDVDANTQSNIGDIIGAGTIGESGHFELQNMPYAYLHPYWMSAVVEYLNDAFVNNYVSYTMQICQEYQTILDEYVGVAVDSNNTEEELALNNNLTEINNILFKLEQGLDYFGNPVGWVPLLSFEVMLNNYNNEIDRAIPTLYMYYWLNRIDQTLQRWVEASQFAANRTEQSINENQNLINSLISEIPVLEDEIVQITTIIDSLTQRIEQLEAQLMAKAKHNVKKKNRIKKAVGICKAVVNVLPVLGPVGVGISAAADLLFASGAIDNLIGQEGSNYSSVYGSINTVNWGQVYNTVNSISFDASSNTSSYFSTYNDLNTKVVKPISTSISQISNLLSQGSAPKSEVDKEFERLCASSLEWNSMRSEKNKLDQRKIRLNDRLKQVENDMNNNIVVISNDILALDAYLHDAFTGNSKRDLNAMLYMKKMEQRAKNRLLKYHYYLRKAYEYRLLKPYQGEFNLVGMFERFEALGMALDSIVDPNAYTALKSVFKDVVSEMAEEIIDEYSTNMPEQSAPITIVIPHEQLDILNADESFTLNFYEMGIFSPDEENVRIVDLGIQHIETHVVGNVGYSGYMDLNMTHQGISIFRKEGQLYWFDHMSRTTTNPHTWGIRYDALSNTTTSIQPSFASTSLLYSILNSSTNMMLFSRPSAWGDINISKKVHSSGGADIVIDSLVLRLQYDFTHRPTNIRNIDITTNDGLLPYIACSEEDRNGRSNGNGNLNRSYNVSNQTVTFSAIEKYGNWYFVNWTNRADVVVSNTMDLTVSRSTDQFYRANYERRVPILSVPDTIEVYYGGGVQTVHVANIGSGDLEMDWYVSDSLSSWVHLNSISEGIDDGMFSFVFDANESGTYRIDSLEIFAPETDIMSKMIYIVQVDSTVYNVSANVVPEGAGTVTGTGFYEPGETVTLIATAVDECDFVSWELNGQVVSTDSIYTFVVNSNVQLTANFTCDEMISVTAEVSPENSGQVFGTGLYHPNDVVTLHAIPFDGYTFANWTYSDILLSDNQDYTFVAVSDVHYVANFQEEVGIGQYDDNGCFKLYPNPTKDLVNVQLTINNEQLDDVEIQLFDVYGRLLEIINMADARGASLQTTQIDFSRYAKGVYFVKAVAEGKIIAVRKVVKR